MALFSITAYGLMNPWLLAYHPAAPILVFLSMALWALLALVLATLAFQKFPRFGFVFAAAAWVSCEYARSSGFAAYPYGIIGYSQWKSAFMLRGAGLAGIWGASFLLALFSAYLAQTLHHIKGLGLKPFFRAWKMQGLPLAVLCAVFAAYLILPLGLKPGAKAESLSILCLQPNFLPRREGSLRASSYAEVLRSMILAGLKDKPDSDLIISSETAFPPSIALRLEADPEDADNSAVREFMRFLKEIEIPIILGNDHGRFGLRPDGRVDRIHENAALAIEGGRITDVYSKQRLVPFIEDFPFYRAFPALYRSLEKEQGFLWTPGTKAEALKIAGLRVGSPICYEDCFGPINRRFALGGASFLASITSDAWSGSQSAMRQHLAFAVFRSAELGLAMVRVSNNGVSALISSSGRILQEEAPFERRTWQAELQSGEPMRSPYLIFGDYLAQACLLASLFLAVFCFATKKKGD